MALGAPSRQALSDRPKTAICCVSEKIQTAHQPNTPRALDFFAFLHLTIFERSVKFEFFNSQLPLTALVKPGRMG
jgi:hypothetical protein